MTAEILATAPNKVSPTNVICHRGRRSARSDHSDNDGLSTMRPSHRRRPSSSRRCLPGEPTTLVHSELRFDQLIICTCARVNRGRLKSPLQCGIDVTPLFPRDATHFRVVSAAISRLVPRANEIATFHCLSSDSNIRLLISTAKHKQRQH